MTGVATLTLPSQPCYQYPEAFSSSQQLTVFCDFDGPIVDVSNRYYATYQQALLDTQARYLARGISLPIQMLSKVQFWQRKQDRVPDVEIAMRSGLQGEQVETFLERVLEIVNEPVLLQKDRVQSDARRALGLFHSQGVRLVLVTLRASSQATQILRNHGLTRLFSGIYGTQDQDMAYRNYAEAKTQLLAKAIAEQIPSTEKQPLAWMVGDTEADLLAGQAMKIPTIALTCGIRSHYYLKQFQPTYIASDLLSAAHYLLNVTQQVSSHKNYANPPF